MPNHRTRRWAATFLMASAFAVTACGGAGEPSPTTPVLTCSVSSVSVSAPLTSITAGGTTTLSASASTSNCSATPATTWNSSNTAVATVSAAGLVTGIANGTAVITATVGGASGSATITVGPPAVSSIDISAATGSLIVGQTMTLVAMPKDAQGALLSGRTITWTSSNVVVLTVQANGLVAGIATGTATITATSEGKSVTSVITVTGVPVSTVSVVVSDRMVPGTTQQASAVLRDASALVLNGRTAAWSSSNVAVATVSATGLVTATAPGTAAIIATSEGKTGSATITVALSIAPVRTVTVTVPSATMAIGASQMASAVARDSLGNAIPGLTIAWSSSNMAVGTVQASGLVAAIAPGLIAITATMGGISGSVAISVPAPAAPIIASVTPTAIDAVFAAVPFSITGTNLNTGGITMALSGTGITGGGFTVNSATSISAQMLIAGGTATTTSNVSVNTFGGMSNTRPMTVYAVGTAPMDAAPQVGATPSVWEGYDCAPGSVGTGANVRMGASLDAFAVRCQSVTGAARTFGAIVPTNSLGGSGGSPGTIACNAGSVMTGVTGTYTSASVLNIVTIAAICSPVAGGATSTTVPAGGAPGAATFSASCPAGLVVTGMQGNDGAIVQTLMLHCR